MPTPNSRHIGAFVLLLVLLASALLPAAGASAHPLNTALPDGFYEEQVAGRPLRAHLLCRCTRWALFITEKAGRVRVVENGILQTDPLLT